ncbi:hypothetical protein M433DRAFT_198085 [Acidomyces richmondensis BFW]|nr:MAG: hypothetical protein FE78DRAFT_145171 [Acidomyces sp. 'richmondensis']KYG46524.1 hypothetical protein M433DRAFT_198085 [Acidomyces richmondensis BFW]
MEDGSHNNHAANTATTPPPPPEPSAADATTIQCLDLSSSKGSDDSRRLDSGDWDIFSISALGALRMLIGALQDLADIMGDVPPTPPVSRPGTPKKMNTDRHSPEESGSGMVIGSPEAHPLEPMTVEVGANAEEVIVQRMAIARRFFSKVAPPFSLSDYLLRLHHWCPHSPAVYLAASAYCHRLCVSDMMVPATNRTVHRLSLAAIRVASKALEDNKWTQDRIAKVGGVNKTQLMNLEVALCFLMDFDLGVSAEMLSSRMYLLQQAGRQGLGSRGKLGRDFKLKLPILKKTSATVAVAT